MLHQEYMKQGEYRTIEYIYMYMYVLVVNTTVHVQKKMYLIQSKTCLLHKLQYKLQELCFLAKIGTFWMIKKTCHKWLNCHFGGQYWLMWHIETHVSTVPCHLWLRRHFIAEITHNSRKQKTTLVQIDHFWHIQVSTISGTCTFQVLPSMAHLSFLVQFRFQLLPLLACFSFCHFWHVLDSTIYGTSAISGSTTLYLCQIVLVVTGELALQS